MSLMLERFLRPQADAGVPAPGDDRWYGDSDQYFNNIPDSGIWNRNSSGLYMSPERALRIITAYACVRVIAESLATVPFILYEQLNDVEDVDEDGDKQEARDNPLWALFRKRPNRWQTPFEFIEMLTGHAALRGNGYAFIQPGASGAVDELIPLHPARMIVRQNPDTFRISYQYTTLHGERKDYTQDQIFHLRGFGSDGVVGLSPVALAREALALSLAAESYGARFFGGSAQPSGVLKHPNKLSKEARERLRKDWTDLHAGLQNAHKVAVLEDGLTWEKTGLTQEDAQFLETRKYQRSEIAALWRVPPHKVGIMDNATFTNIEQQSMEFVMDTLLPWAVRWETACARDFIADDENLYFKFKLQSLLRGDTATRYAAYATAHTTGWMSINEIRREEDLNGIGAKGDDYMQPLNMAPTGQPTPVPGAPKPPAVPPVPGKSNPVPPPVPGKKKAMDERLAVFVADAANRITHHEIRELEKRTTKAAHRERFHEWAHTFFQDHQAYVGKVLEPFGLGSVAVQRIVAAGETAWTAEVLPSLPLWSATRPAEIGHIIEQSLEPPEVEAPAFEATPQADGKILIKRVVSHGR